MSVSGAAVGAVIPLAATYAFNFRPSATYNSAQNEYVVAYEAESGGGSVIAAQRIRPSTGQLVGGAVQLYTGLNEKHPEIAYNSDDNQFLAISWNEAGTGTWFIHGRRLLGDLTPTGQVLSLATQGGGQGIGLAYNSVTNTYLGLHQHPATDQISGVLISNTGVASTQFLAMSATAPQPELRAAASTRTGRWLSVGSWRYQAVMSQLLQGSTGGGGGTLPPAPSLVSPSGTINTPSPTYTWRASAGATYYQLWVTDSSGAARVQAWYTATSACGSGSTCSATPNSGLAPGRGYWWVQAWNPNGYSPWSAEMSFTLANNLPVAISPSGTVSTAPILFTWSAVPGATMYYLWVNDSSGPKFQGWILSSVACAGGASTCSVNASPPLFAGNGYWWILAWGPTTGYSPWSARRSFTIAPLTAAPQLLTPSGALSGANIEFGWLPSANATMYYLWVNDSTGTRVQEWLAASAVCGSGICTRTISPSLSSGAGTWWVQPWSSTGGYGPWSEPLTFVR